MAPHVERRRTEPAHRVLGIDHFAARDPPAQKRFRPFAGIEDVCFQPWLGAVPPES